MNSGTLAVVNLFAAPVFVLMGVLISLYVKNTARSASEDEFSKNIKSALAVFKMELIESLDETYVRRGECTLRMEAQDDRIDVNTLSITDVEKRIRDFKTAFGKPNILRKVD